MLPELWVIESGQIPSPTSKLGCSSGAVPNHCHKIRIPIQSLKKANPMPSEAKDFVIKFIILLFFYGIFSI